VSKNPIEKLRHSKYDLDIVLRKYQTKSLRRIIFSQRGVILSPTGSGKTFIILAACSVFRNTPILFLCNTKDLLAQMVEESQIHMAHLRPQIIGGGMSRVIDHNADIIMSTIQSFSKINAMDYSDYFGMVIVDECHHVNSRSCQFGEVVQSMLAPVKLGFTATLPEGRKEKLALEGIIGPVLYEYTTKEGIKSKVLAEPKITLVPVARTKMVGQYHKYRDLYTHGIVNSRVRNGSIVQIVHNRVEQQKSVLIMIKDIDHGDILRSLLRRARVKVAFVQGSTASVLRKETKVALSSKKIKVVISTAVWREGINIPSLDVVVNACGGKSEIMTLQAIGRGFRVTDEKSQVEVVDFLDPYRYLAEHTIQRLAVYYREGWIK